MDAVKRVVDAAGKECNTAAIIIIFIHDQQQQQRTYIRKINELMENEGNGGD